MPPILFYFFISSELDPLKIDQMVIPLRSRQSFIIFYPPVVTAACFWLIVVWYLMFGGRPRPRRISFYY
jgi:hypothetical protein